MKTTSTERLFKLSSKQKENLKTLTKLHRMINYTYKPNIKITKSKWVDKLYEKGINSIKKEKRKLKMKSFK